MRIEMTNVETSVWLVAEYLQYEGILDGTLRLFHSRGAAEAYAAELREPYTELGEPYNGGTDNVQVWKQTVT
jgi:hypothetical protein